METCANCGRPIGYGEAPHLRGGKVVCRTCVAGLPPAMPPLPSAPTISLPPGKLDWRRNFICPNPNCKYVGPLQRKSRGIVFVITPLSILIFFLGLMVADGDDAGLGELIIAASLTVFVAGLLVAAVVGDKFICPACGNRIPR